jgi:hypothetical protein
MVQNPRVQATNKDFIAFLGVMFPQFSGMSISNSSDMIDISFFWSIYSWGVKTYLVM